MAVDQYPSARTRRKRAKRRDWTLAELDRDRTYILFFDPRAFRWEVRMITPATDHPPTDNR